MIEISKVQFVEKADEHRRNVTRIIGGIKMHVEVCVDERENVPRKIVHDNIREQIWHKVYGDLRKPLAELQCHALREARPEYSYRVQELCEQLNALLALKSPNKPIFPPVVGELDRNETNQYKPYDKIQ